MPDRITVIGAGFGGLATALRLAEHGVPVTVCERLSYPGGCASTFERDGYRFESGATLFSGFGEGQLFRRFIDRHAMDIAIDWLDPVVELRSPTLTLPIPRSRDAFVAQLAERATVPTPRLRAFFEAQHRVAEPLWRMLDDPSRLPPAPLGKLVARDTLSLFPWVGRSLESVLERYRVHEDAALRLYLDAVCQITVQCASRESEALFALGAMDYYFRGTAHVRGGIGKLAWALVEAIRRLGGEVLLANPVRGLRREGNAWHVETKEGVVASRVVAANLLPQNAVTLVEEGVRGRFVERLSRRVETGYGAAMLYRVVRAPEGAPGAASHLQLVAEPDRPLVEGNHVFCSFSGEDDEGRAPRGFRTLTASTHVDLPKLLSLEAEARAGHIEAVHARMRATLAGLAPEWEDIAHEITASPRTFERFTGRYAGFVGGIPRRAGLSNYRDLGSRALLPGLYLVGDSVFPGQSTLATAAGGLKLADALVA